MERLVVKENAESSFEERIVKEARLPARDSMNATVLYGGLTCGYTARGQRLWAWNLTRDGLLADIAADFVFSDRGSRITRRKSQQFT
jgi:hypothetical protein